MDISKGKNSSTNQKNLRSQSHTGKMNSKSLNYHSKKKEAERIDRENQRIL
jgi:hypothetical protein